MAADLTIEPPAGFIYGPGNLHSFVVTAHGPAGALRDITRKATYTLSDAGVVVATAPGVFKSVAEGVVRITASFGGRSASAALVVGSAPGKTWDFSTDIAPILSKFGCGGSNCHGALNGQSGFKLSLFGYDPDADYEAVVKQSGGRRVDVSAPEKSLLLLKPTLAIAHGGGRRFGPDFPEYSTLREWIRSGAPKGKSRGVRLASIRIYPEGLRVLSGPEEKQQFFVQGHYSDGSRADLTRTVQYTSSDDTVVAISPAGLVIPKKNGEVTILVRTLGQVASTRVAVALNPPVRLSAIPLRTVVDQFIFDKLSRVRIEPSPLTGDNEFIRRIYLDVIGTLPTEKETLAFLADERPDKRDRLVDELLERPEYAQFWAQKWGDLFMMAPLYVHDNSLYSHEYFRRNFASDKPYNEVAREMITGLGTMAEVGPNNFYTRENRRTIEEYSTFVSQTFLGVSLECARCHDHPREKWARDDYLGIAAFFSQVKIKEGVSYRPFEGLVTLNYGAEFKHPQTLQIIRPRLLDGTEPSIRPMIDRREILANWITLPDNPFFARAAVNRVWRQLMGRGLVEPVDDARPTNPPSHPELNERLAEYFIEHGFRFKPLMRIILKSSTYQLSAASTKANGADNVNYSHYYLRRLTAEQLLDAVSAVTGVPEKFRGFYRGKRAIDLPDSGVPSYFLDTYDRPVRDVAKCERNATTTVTQAMHSLGGDTINARLKSGQGRLAKLISESASDEAIIKSFYIAALSRPPAPPEMETAKQFVTKSPNRRQGLEGVVWSLLNSKEFLFNH